MSVFEFNIRFLGGLLSLYGLTKDEVCTYLCVYMYVCTCIHYIYVSMYVCVFGTLSTMLQCMFL